MQKLFVLFFLVLSPVFLFGQKTIKVVSFATITGKPNEKVTYFRSPVFQQDNATLTCDSAVYYTERNYFEAYNNVHITQPGMDIYSDQLQYDGNRKHAHLTNNVRMVDPTSILTTNILDYDMVAKIGTYTSGGKIVNKEVTLTSKNGYYFSESSDAYFRYNVVVVTPQTLIKSDTMRYNTQSKWTYFYGPTNIKGKDDNLYTENGAYNTQTENAYFGKKNLYTQDTKSLKGDSLYYDGIAGIGKAVRNIVFEDKKDKTKLFGDLGFYYKSDQRTMVMGHAYLGIGTQDSVTIKNKKRADSLWLGADTLETKMVLQKTLKLIPKISIKADNQIGDDDDAGPEKKKKTTEAKYKPEPTTTSKKPKIDEKRKKKKNRKTDDSLVTLPDSLINKADSLLKNPSNINTDSLQKTLKPAVDSLVKTRKGNKVDLKNYAEKVLSKDSALIDPKLKNSKELQTKVEKAIKTGVTKDSALVKSVVKNGKISPNDLKKTILTTAGKDSTSKIVDVLKKGIIKVDSVVKFNPADTVQARTIKAYHNVKIYKSNIQAKTDSLFYTSADSTMRCYINPIIWSEGSQQIGDTIYVQFKKNKLNNLQSIKNAFLVNTPKDSLRFNQIKGRLMTGFFTDGKLKTLYVDGNAESIYFTQDDSTKVYKEVNQTLSSRIKFVFKDNDIQDILYIKGVEGALNPDNTVKKDKTLTGFSWKPKERPISKKDVIGSALKKKSTNKTVVKATEKAKPGAKEHKKASPIIEKPKVTLKQDSVIKEPVLKEKLKIDTANNFGIKPIFPKKDSVSKEKVKVVGKL
ncbi:hypothetical protein EZJ43_14950 [Pedobacter changchengzhani]|uniref:Organic solvent tolerance-like N-terminal domain-containing protein n=1 Tax=Pedobacter changchengzhani TaxID=2529274 RepID=A0A4R5MI27_9SPHI|nr:OstA-like protein [Pedobacter changchengzhani]TDG35194.1 hypothetical protein EZJ43_14950 [Pedobacter changchengzhani]